MTSITAARDLWLGLDTGGTYTDAVLLADGREVVASAKSLTTPWNLAIGIGRALRAVLDLLPQGTNRANITLVSMSTTLATNAVVENRFSPVCTLVIGFDDAMVERSLLLRHGGRDIVIRVPGGHSATGDESAPLDEAAINRAVIEHAERVEAFAVAANFSVRNPAHELRARKLIRALSPKPVTCAHELSSKLDAPRRALTAALNARLTPQIRHLIEALSHGGIANKVQVNLDWIESEVFENEDPAPFLEHVDGILVPGGFGQRGAEGKIRAARFAREHDVPYFGICFGMQMAVIEAARNLCGIEAANSTEFGATSEPVVGLMTEWMKGNELQKRGAASDLGGTMRLGAYPAVLARGSKVADIYHADEISERHRHRYEVNTAYKDRLAQHGMRFSGMSPDGLLPEIIEFDDHPWFIGVQFHPELKSRPFAPHPLFSSFIGAAVEQSRLV